MARELFAWMATDVDGEERIVTVVSESGNRIQLVSPNRTMAEVGREFLWEDSSKPPARLVRFAETEVLEEAYP